MPLTLKKTHQNAPVARPKLLLVVNAADVAALAVAVRAAKAVVVADPADAPADAPVAAPADAAAVK